MLKKFLWEKSVFFNMHLYFLMMKSLSIYSILCFGVLLKLFVGRINDFSKETNYIF